MVELRTTLFCHTISTAKDKTNFSNSYESFAQWLLQLLKEKNLTTDQVVSSVNQKFQSHLQLCVECNWQLIQVWDGRLCHILTTLHDIILQQWLYTPNINFSWTWNCFTNHWICHPRP
jgi:hypothetical protein